MLPVEIDARFASARPRVLRAPAVVENRLEWIDGQGEPLKEILSLESPCALLAWTIYDAPEFAGVYETLVRAVLHPGTRSDYLEAVRFATTHMELPRPEDVRWADWLLEICEIGMQLVEADPGRARDAERRTSQDPTYVVQAPFVKAAGLWRSSGYLKEAASIEDRQVAALGDAGPTPARQALAALLELRA